MSSDEKSIKRAIETAAARYRVSSRAGKRRLVKAIAAETGVPTKVTAATLDALARRFLGAKKVILATVDETSSPTHASGSKKRNIATHEHLPGVIFKESPGVNVGIAKLGGSKNIATYEHVPGVIFRESPGVNVGIAKLGGSKNIATYEHVPGVIFEEFPSVGICRSGVRPGFRKLSKTLAVRSAKFKGGVFRHVIATKDVR